MRRCKDACVQVNWDSHFSERSSAPGSSTSAAAFWNRGRNIGGKELVLLHSIHSSPSLEMMSLCECNILVFYGFTKLFGVSPRVSH